MSSSVQSMFHQNRKSQVQELIELLLNKVVESCTNLSDLSKYLGVGVGGGDWFLKRNSPPPNTLHPQYIDHMLSGFCFLMTDMKSFNNTTD